ncbi:site-specific integrase [Phenylobacterium sp. LH3H17]|uniref:site-specific integrase n=1 Tax=Phenylobacterium sp. LH3H17 TaxID=2903901 RepID=UPI0020C99A5F|nr:site-specific integrase [Phenylobacterium sp. LH3H17]UTP40080.1 site-specific integrase [Phenylobacterium sp. LH3H17]
MKQIAFEVWSKGVEGIKREHRVNRTPDAQMAVADEDEWATQTAAGLADPTRALRTRWLLRRDIEEVLQISAEAECRKRGLPVGGHEQGQIADALFEAEVGKLQARSELAHGLALPTVDHRLVPSQQMPKGRGASWTFSEWAERALSAQPSGASWQHKVRKVADDFEAFLPRKKAIYEIEKGDIQDFVDFLIQCPNRSMQRFPGLSLRDAVRANNSRQGELKPFRTVSPNTIRDTQFAVLRWVLAFAHARDAVAFNPATGVKVPGARKKGGRKSAFQIEELNALFAHPTFVGCRSPIRPNTPGDYLFADHRVWAPLLMLFTGARPSELAQLKVSDVKLGHRYPHINILTEYDPDDPDDHEYTAFKTENARRQVPIHPELDALGFASYVAKQPKAGRLFPEWKSSPDARKLYSSAGWIRRINDTYIPAITNRKPKPTLYSLRHTFKTQMARDGVPAQNQNQILGHAQVGMDPNYLDDLGIESHYEHVRRVNYRGLDLSSLRSKYSKS